jgi:hypothetical protein
VAAALADLDEDVELAVSWYDALRDDLREQGDALVRDGLDVDAVAALLLMNRDEDNLDQFLETYGDRRSDGARPMPWVCPGGLRSRWYAPSPTATGWGSGVVAAALLRLTAGWRSRRFWPGCQARPRSPAAPWRGAGDVPGARPGRRPLDQAAPPGVPGLGPARHRRAHLLRCRRPGLRLSCATQAGDQIDVPTIRPNWPKHLERKTPD